MTYANSYTEPWIKYLSAKNTKYILKCWERTAKRSLISVSDESKKLIFWSTFSYIVKTFLKILCWRFLVPCSEHFLVCSATLSSETQNILTLSMLVYYNTNSFFLRSFSLMHWLLVCSSSLIIKVLGFIVSFCSFISLLRNIVSSEDLFRVWYQHFQMTHLAS